MNELLAIANSPWWLVVCALGWALIYWDWKHPTNRRLVVAFSVALLSGVGLSAATLPNPDWCAQFERDGNWVMWLLYGCAFLP